VGQRRDDRAGATAERLGLATGDVVEIARGDRSLALPVLLLPGQPRESVTLHLGGGRRRCGKVGDGVGFDVYRLRTRDALHFASAGLRKLEGTHRLAATDHHHLTEGRDLVRTATLAEWDPQSGKNPFAHEPAPPAADESLYPPYPYEGYRWGMSIDLSTCIGCNACVVACQAENNIPVVGKTEVLRGREMHWIRVDTYYQGPADSPQTYFEPVPCMHCENAPCELVCPVFATVHSSEGLNQMVYNRCVGTRYCSNNCPYKVRRFNFFHYSDIKQPVLKLLQNPDVTVRSRGVMEKCTYCVQRISAARIDAEKEGRRVRDGEVLTACQQACPAGAIVFGDLNDAASRVKRLQADPRDYALLAELNTRPRTTYLAAVRNPNPALEDRSAGPQAHE
jgi:molybdopterin-containing oxidoreductase family iron-sulfur binding subunit